MKSLTQKIWIPILTTLLFLIVALYAALHFYYREHLLEQAHKQYRNEDRLLMNNADTYANAANSCLNMIILQLNQALSASELDAGGYPVLNTATQSKMRTCLLNSLRLFQDAEEVNILFSNGYRYTQKKNGDFQIRSGKEEQVESIRPLDINTRGTWIHTNGADYQLEENSLYCMKPYTNIESGKKTGYVILKMKEFIGFGDMLYDARNVYLFNADGLLLETNDKEASHLLEEAENYQDQLLCSQQLQDELKMKDTRKFFCTSETIGKGLQMIAVTSLENSVLVLDRTIRMIFLIVGIVILVLFLMIGQSIAQTVRPIQSLSAHMTQVGEELPEDFEIESSCREVKVLVNSYNDMTHRNRRLVTQRLESAKREKQLELLLLQEQIKPHFLYNTLDTIYCLNALGDHSEASAMVKRLSEYYRLALSKGMESIRLSKELNMVRLYLEIQQTRFKKVLTYSVECEDTVPDILIPKLLLQPLVENAVVHGIQPMAQVGCVTVRVTYAQGVEIRVQDDGIGFPKEQFEKIISGEEWTKQGYGLKNVAERLKLVYGKHCEFLLESVQKGTSILIRITEKKE